MLEAMPRPTARRGPEGRGFGARPVVDRIDRLCQQHLGLDRLPHRQDVSPSQGVPLADIGGRDPELAGEEVHLRLVSEHHLHAAEAAEGGCRRVIGVGAPGTQPHIAHPVRARTRVPMSRAGQGPTRMRRRRSPQ